MTVGFSRRLLKSGRSGVFGVAAAAAVICSGTPAFAQTPNVYSTLTGSGGSTSTQQAEPQVPVLQPMPTTGQTGQTGQTGPVWPGQIRRAQDMRPQDYRGPEEPQQPTEFQRVLAQTVGSILPIFGANLFANAPSTFAPVQDAQVSQDYVIGPGDEVRITASGQFNQQGSFVVDRAGTITIPEVGALPVSGLKFSELQPYLKQRIGRVYRNFELSVTLGQLRSIQVYVLGETRHPGAYTVSSMATLVNALLVSGGVRSQGSLRRIELHRAGRTVTTLDLYDLLLNGDKTKDAQLLPGDVIFVPAVGPQVALAGSVNNPAIYELKDETTLGELLKLARGLTVTASDTHVRVESVLNRSERSLVDISLSNNMGMAVHGGDLVTVNPISDRFKDVITLRGNVANPGRYKWHEGMRLSDLIPDREALITRGYYRQRNLLGSPVAPYVPAQGHVAVSTSPTGTNSNAAPTVSSGGSVNSNAMNAGNPDAAQVQSTYPTQVQSTFPTQGVTETPNLNAGPSVAATAGTDAPTSSTASSSNATGGGSTVGDALTQSNSAFTAVNDVVLSGPDVDLAYAVIERLDPVTLTTSLFPFNLGAMLNGDATQNLALQPGDVVTIFSKSDLRVPQSQQTRFVRLEGEFPGAGVYSVRPGETLRQLITRAGGLTPDAYLYASEFTRQSQRRLEQQRLREYADSLDTQINIQASTQVASSLDPQMAATTAVASAQAARNAVARIRAMKTTGRIVLRMKPDAVGVDAVPDIPLEDGDRFIVPRQPSSVAVAGQVYSASSFLFQPKLQVRHYLRDAGGPDRNSDPKRIYVVRADGSVVSRQYADVLKAGVLPGDTIVVPPQLTHKNLFRDIVTISSALGTLAVPLTAIAIIK